MIADRDEIGQLLVLVNRDDSSVLVLRSNDGRVQRLDLDQDLDQTGIDTVWLDGDVVAALADGNAVDFAHLLPEQGLVYLGGLAVDATTLASRSERDLPDVSRIVGLHPTRAGQLVAVDRERRNLVRIDLDGTVRGEATYAGRDLNASVNRVVDDPAGVAMVRSADVYFLHFDIGLLR